MYCNNYVLTILKSNTPQKEMNGKIGLPFNTEYKIRLKNKNSRRAKAKVSIDGVQVCGLGDFVIGAHSSLDLERFIDTSLTKGRKFKFVSIDHQEVDDPTSSENGIIKVEFRTEKQMPVITLPVHPVKLRGQRDYTYWYNNTGDTNTFDNFGNQDYIVSFFSSDCKSLVDQQAGATVGGEISNQQFCYADAFDVENVPTTLTLQLISSRDLNIKKEKIAKDKYTYPLHCYNCGKGCKSKHKYCSSCGTTLK